MPPHAMHICGMDWRWFTSHPGQHQWAQARRGNKATHLPPPRPGSTVLSVASDGHVLGTANLIRSWLVAAS